MKRSKKRFGAYSPEQRRQSRRLLVVLLSALLIVFISIYLTAILIIRFSRWFPVEIPQHGLGLLFAVIIVLAVFIIPFVIFTILGSILWYFIMSFYLTVEECQELNRVSTPYAPIITPVITKISNVMLNWKIERERKAK